MFQQSIALKAAYTALKVDEHDNALVIASELASRLFKASRYEAVGTEPDFDAEFLRQDVRLLDNIMKLGVVPESGRFNTVYMQLTVVEE